MTTIEIILFSALAIALVTEHYFTKKKINKLYYELHKKDISEWISRNARIFDGKTIKQLYQSQIDQIKNEQDETR